MTASREAAPAHPPLEISGGYHLGHGWLRVVKTSPLRAILARREGKVVGGLAFDSDECDRCLRLVASFATDDLSTGALLNHTLKLGQERLNVLYVEVDVRMSAPRLLKSAEQLGFVPVTYLPGFSLEQGQGTDVVKLVKLNLVYSLEQATLTTATRRVVDIIDHNFQDQKVGVAIIKLLETLSVFGGLGDGELRKIARLFTQKLFRPGDAVFHKGDSGEEAYVVMRGQVDIILTEGKPPVASMHSGQIFGEQAFLESTTRVAGAVASQPTILLIVRRTAFNLLAQTEPHLGMVVLRNIAIELSNKLRHANASLAQNRAQ